jgi:transposase
VGTLTYKNLQRHARELGLSPFGKSQVQLEAEIQQAGSATPTKSSQIRALHDEGYSVSEIARMLGINYSFAYGVVKKHTGTKREATPRPPSRSQQIRKLAETGVARKEICTQLGVTYSLVYNALNNPPKGGTKG